MSNELNKLASQLSPREVNLFNEALSLAYEKRIVRAYKVVALFNGLISVGSVKADYRQRLIEQSEHQKKINHASQMSLVVDASLGGLSLLIDAMEWRLFMLLCRCVFRVAGNHDSYAESRPNVIVTFFIASWLACLPVLADLLLPSTEEQQSLSDLFLKLDFFAKVMILALGCVKSIERQQQLQYQFNEADEDASGDLDEQLNKFLAENKGVSPVELIELFVKKTSWENCLLEACNQLPLDAQGKLSLLRSSESLRLTITQQIFGYSIRHSGVDMPSSILVDMNYAGDEQPCSLTLDEAFTSTLSGSSLGQSMLYRPVPREIKLNDECVKELRESSASLLSFQGN